MHHRPLKEIAAEISQDWGDKVHGTAKSYLDGMRNLSSVHDTYRSETGGVWVAYFIAAAGTWRGPTARRVKLELRQMLKDYDATRELLRQ